MNILLVSDAYLPTVSGVASSSDSIARFMASQGHHVTLIAPKPLDGYVPKSQDRLAFVFTPGVSDSLFVNKSMTIFPLGLGPMWQAFRSQKFDIVHIQEPGSLGITAILLAKLFRVPIVGAMHFSWPQIERVAPWAIRWISVPFMKLYVRVVYRAYDAIMVDARGHGRSEAPERGYGPGEQADDLAGVIAALGLRKPAILGHSMGAATTLVLAGRYPDLPGAILLEDPPAWWTSWYETLASQELRDTMKANAQAYQTASREELVAAARERHIGWSEAELEPWAAAKHRFSPHVLSVFEAGNPANVDWQATLRRITCPALLITGDPPLGAIVTEESAALLKALVPHLEIAHVPGTGHNIRRENFARFLAVVRGFLGEVVSRESYERRQDGKTARRQGKSR